MPKPTYDPSEWNARIDGSKKGNGFLGVLPRPDGSVSSELSMGTTDVNGKETEIPLLVPTLTAQEVKYLLSAPPDDWPHPTMKAISQKAVEFARQRAAAGKDFFAQPGEEDLSVLPEVQRAVPVGAEAMATSRKPADASLLQQFLLQRRDQ